MSHTTGNPYFLDNGAGGCWHCGRPKSEHPQRSTYEANFAGKVYRMVDPFHMAGWTSHEDPNAPGGYIPHGAELRELGSFRDRLLVETVEPQYVPYLGEKRTLYAWVDLNKVKFLRFEKETK